MSKSKANLKPFRIKYAILPITFMVLGIILAAIYVWKLPEIVDIQFNTDGDPVKQGSPWMATLIWIGGTVIIAALCVLFTRFLATRPFLTNENVIMKPENLVTLMGNIPAIASAVIVYAYWDICIYNLTGEHFIPLWIFALIILGISAVALLIFMGKPFISSMGKDLYGVKKMDQEEKEALEQSLKEDDPEAK